MVDYNTKIMLVINGKDVSIYRFPWPAWYFMWQWLIFRLCRLKIQAYGAIFISASMSAFMLIWYMDSKASRLVYSILMWFRGSCFSTLSWSTAGIINLLPIIALLSWLQSHLWLTSMAAGIFVLKLWLMVSHVVWVLSACLYAHHLALLFLFLLLTDNNSYQSGMSMHDCIALMVVHMPGMSSSLFVLWLCLES